MDNDSDLIFTHATEIAERRERGARMAQALAVKHAVVACWTWISGKLRPVSKHVADSARQSS